MQYNTHIDRPDVILIGSGIMSSNLGAMLKKLDPNMKIQLYEVSDELAKKARMLGITPVPATRESASSVTPRSRTLMARLTLPTRSRSSNNSSSRNSSGGTRYAPE